MKVECMFVPWQRGGRIGACGQLFTAVSRNEEAVALLDVLVMIGTFLYFQDTNRLIGTTGWDALFSAMTNAAKATPVPTNKPMMTGEPHAYASPARLSATIRRVSHETRKPMPKRSSDLIAVRMLVACDGAGMCTE